MNAALAFIVELVITVLCTAAVYALTFIGRRRR
jgi:hypothetical protein